MTPMRILVLIGLALGGCSGAPAVTSHCSDGELSGDETDADCGGACPGCEIGQACQTKDDCAVGTCVSGVCGLISTCDSDIQCAPDESCDNSGECVSNASCTGDGDCPLDQSCGADGICVRNPRCDATTPCTPPLSCGSEGICIRKTGTHLAGELTPAGGPIEGSGYRLTGELRFGGHQVSGSDYTLRIDGPILRRQQ